MGSDTTTDPVLRGPAEAAFDRWLRDGLRREYTALQHEPVPDYLLRLLEGKPDRFG